MCSVSEAESIKWTLTFEEAGGDQEANKKAAAQLNVRDTRMFVNCIAAQCNGFTVVHRSGLLVSLKGVCLFIKWHIPYVF